MTAPSQLQETGGKSNCSYNNEEEGSETNFSNSPTFSQGDFSAVLVNESLSKRRVEELGMTLLLVRWKHCNCDSDEVAHKAHNTKQINLLQAWRCSETVRLR